MRDPGARAREFEAKYDAYGSMVYRLAMVYLGGHADAEDVVQEAFMRLLYRAPQFTDAGHEKRWLIRVTVNLCRDQLKGFWKKKAVELEDSCLADEPELFGVADAVVRLPEERQGPHSPALLRGLLCSGDSRYTGTEPVGSKNAA